jgi:hypothetical protein
LSKCYPFCFLSQQSLFAAFRTITILSHDSFFKVSSPRYCLKTGSSHYLLTTQAAFQPRILYSSFFVGFAGSPRFYARGGQQFADNLLLFWTNPVWGKITRIPNMLLSVSQAKAGIKAKLAECFCDRDKAVVLGDVEYAWCAPVDREQGRMGRCVDVQRRRSGRLIPPRSRSVYLTITQHHAFNGRRHCGQVFERCNAFHNDSVRCVGAAIQRSIFSIGLRPIRVDPTSQALGDNAADTGCKSRRNQIARSLDADTRRADNAFCHAARFKMSGKIRELMDDISGQTVVIARDNAGASNTSTTIGVTPAVFSSATFLSERVVPKTSQPASSNCGTSRLPIAPVAPARNTFAMFVSPVCWGAG